jgi:hypothetical protein
MSVNKWDVEAGIRALYALNQLQLDKQGGGDGGDSWMVGDGDRRRVGFRLVTGDSVQNGASTARYKPRSRAKGAS